MVSFLSLLHRQSSAPAMLSRQVTARSASNLTTTSSISNTSLASSSGCGSKKRRAPVPPNLLPLLKPQSEIDEENYNESGLSLGGPVGATVTASSGGGADSDTSLSDKQSGQRQSSVEVEVDVHYRKNSYTNTPISINTSKDEDNYSSTPVSSLSSPGSYLSNSSTSSPLPPNLTEISTSKEYGSSSSTPPITHKSNFCKEASEPGTGNIMQSSTDDDSVSTQGKLGGSCDHVETTTNLNLVHAKQLKSTTEVEHWGKFLNNLETVLQKRAEFI